MDAAWIRFVCKRAERAGAWTGVVDTEGEDVACSWVIFEGNIGVIETTDEDVGTWAEGEGRGDVCVPVGCSCRGGAADSGGSGTWHVLTSEERE